MFVESATLLCQKVNLMNQFRAKGEFTDTTVLDMKKKNDQDVQELLAEIYQE